MARFEPIDSDIRVTDDFAVRDQHRRGRDAGAALVVLLTCEGHVRRAPVRYALSLQYPAHALRIRGGIQLDELEFGHRQSQRCTLRQVKRRLGRARGRPPIGGLPSLPAEQREDLPSSRTWLSNTTARCRWSPPRSADQLVAGLA